MGAHLPVNLKLHGVSSSPPPALIRSARALGFLESLVIDFLTQLNRSLQVVQDQPPGRRAAPLGDDVGITMSLRSRSTG